VACNFPAGTSLQSEAPASSFMGSDLHMRRSPSRTANSDRHSLKESNPILLRGLEKGKPQSESLFFSGNLRSHEGSHSEENRIIAQFSMPAQGLPDHEPGQVPCRVRLFCGSLIISTSFPGRARADFVYRDADGSLVVGEAKNGSTAALNPNQKSVYGELQKGGGQFVGGNAREAGLPQSVGPTQVRVF
jgi:hypothetical protein